jgi:type II secretory pathway pseudopilin PulG
MSRIVPNPAKAPQQGAALVVGLLLLLVLTLLAVSGMNTASVELIMAGNTQYYQNAFQAAETAIEQGYVHGEFNPAVVHRIPALPPPAEEEEDSEEKTPTAPGEPVPGSSTDYFIATITPQLNGAALPALWGSSWDSFSTYHFEVRGEGISARNARADNRQGVAVISPADSTVTPLNAAAPELD